MKTFFSFLILMSVPAFAGTNNCRGVQDERGAVAFLEQHEVGAFSITYTTASGLQSRTCAFDLDSNYTPKTAKPKKDRYVLDEKSSVNCRAKFVWMSKTVPYGGKGYVEVEFPCWGGGGCGHGEAGATESFYCEL